MDVGVARALALKEAVVVGDSVGVAVPLTGVGVLLAEQTEECEAVCAAEVVGDWELPGVALERVLGVPVPLGVKSTAVPVLLLLGEASTL